jgi:hypothetical protein
MTDNKDEQPFRPELQALVGRFSAWWDAEMLLIGDADTVREPLFHYTDSGGLLGIVTSEKMWFTDLFHLNDPSELGFGADIAGDILQERSAGGEAVARFCRWANHVLVKSGGEIFRFYVASFSRKENDLSQWRAYADDARGVAIGLDPSLFQVVEASGLSDIEKYFVARVHYGRDLCMRRVSEAIDQAIGIFGEGIPLVSSREEEGRFGEALVHQLAAPLLWYAATCKHEAYAHEEETRLLLINDVDMLARHTEARVRGSKLVPYIPVPLRVRSPGALTKIIVGPASRDLAEDAVQALLRRFRISTGIVEKSEIPYTSHRP